MITVFPHCHFCKSKKLNHVHNKIINCYMYQVVKKYCLTGIVVETTHY